MNKTAELLYKLSLKQNNVSSLHILLSQIFVKLHSFLNNFFQNKQRELFHTKKYSEGLYFNLKH